MWIRLTIRKPFPGRSLKRRLIAALSRWAANKVSLVLKVSEYYIQPKSQTFQSLLIVSMEHPNRQPSILTNLESICQSVQLLHLSAWQIPTIKFKVLLNPGLCDTLGYDGPFTKSGFFKLVCPGEVEAFSKYSLLEKKKITRLELQVKREKENDSTA